MSRLAIAVKPKPTVVSLFSGCGGSDEGLINAGFNILLANDILPYARDVYLANHPETDFILGDVVDIKSFPCADLLVGCYPCQGFSQGGARQADRKINYLYREFLRALKLIKPKAFIVENVSGMQRADFVHLLNAQLTSFRFAGYRVKWSLLKAEEFGVPQERRRIIIVGVRSDIDATFEFPEPSHGPSRQSPFVSIGESIGDLPLWPEGEFWIESFHWYYLSRNRYRNWDETSKTIVSHPRHMPLHPISPKLVHVGKDKWEWGTDAPARRFSYREAARLQGFAREMIFPSTEADSLRMRYTVVGNAVPPPLFAAVANALPDIW